MNLLEELKKYYGNGDIFVMDDVTINYEHLNEKKKRGILDVLKKERPKNFGFPDISNIEKALKNIPHESCIKGGNKFFWCVCNECGTKYWYTMHSCPTCYERYKKNVCNYSVETGDMIPDNVIKYVCEHIETCKSIKINKTCYTCDIKIKGMCKNIGNSKWNCREEQCECMRCCAIYKKEEIRAISEYNKKRLELEK